MIRRTFALALCAGIVAACQAAPPPAPKGIEGNWLSADGIFTATFGGGQFTSVDSRTNAVLAQGTYRGAGSTVNLQWVSARRQQQYTAVCNFTGPDTVHCEQAGATGFDLQRAV